ncbi:MAG TPA: hypothetical protein VGO47_06140 [Chlamydiales bacterium]|nr:hypothetical protein [Chlamydiales bacterium]
MKEKNEGNAEWKEREIIRKTYLNQVHFGHDQIRTARKFARAGLSVSGQARIYLLCYLNGQPARGAWRPLLMVVT